MSWFHALIAWFKGLFQGEAEPVAVEAAAAVVEASLPTPKQINIPQAILEEGDSTKFLAELKAINPHAHNGFPPSEDILKELKKIADQYHS